MAAEAEPSPEEDGDSKAASGGNLTIEQALNMYDDYKTAWGDIYREASIDLKMALGDQRAHWGEGWDATFKRLPKGRPAIVQNEMPQYIHQVTNDIRQNTPSIKVLPEGDADQPTADAYTGIIRGIEYKSSADIARDNAAEYAVKCSIGFTSIDHDYIDDETDDQELQVKLEPDPLSILIDPASIEMDGSDANGGIKLIPINEADFKKKYKGKKFTSFTDPTNKDAKGSIVLGKIFIRETSGRHNKTITIHEYLFSGEDRLDYTTFPGDFIPIIPYYGEVTWIDGKRKIGSLIRQAREPQRRLNHMVSKESQVLAMAPIAPVMAEEGTLVNDSGQWQRPGEEMVLYYKKTGLKGQPADMPTRLQPPPPSTAFIEAIQSCKDAIKESMGIYNAGLGKREGDASGKALEALQHEGDTATFHFPDNVRRSVAQEGRILVSAIPVIVDTPRIMMAVNEEQDTQMIGVNGAPQQPKQAQPVDLKKGRFHVRVDTGVGYRTKRKEAGKLFGDLIQTNPDLIKIIGDLWAKNLDVAGAEALGARLRKVIPPQLLDDAPQQDPQVMQLTQHIQGLMQGMQQLQSALNDKNADRQLKRDEIVVKDKMADIQARQVELQYGPAPDSQQVLMQHHLDETAADNQLARDLFQGAVETAMQPPPQAPANGAVQQPPKQGQ